MFAAVSVILLQIVDIIASNWVGIVLNLFGIGASIYGTNVLANRIITNAREERLNQAKDDVLDILEQKVTSGVELSSDKISHLMSAADRKHDVELTENYDQIDLLQDLLFRIEEKRYIDIEQKSDYSKYIQDKIQEIRKEDQQSKIPNDVEEILEKLEGEVNGEDTDALIQDLRQKVVTDESGREIRMSTSMPMSLSAAVSIFTVLIYLIVVSRIFTLEVFRELTDILLPNSEFVILILVFTMIYIVLTWARISKF